MGESFINLSNEVLRRLNEVEIDALDFASCRGVQALAKDSVRAAVAKINQMGYEWPFNAAETSVTLIPGKSEYAFPDTVKTVDWETFQIVGNEGLGVDFRVLTPISRDEWYRKYRDRDYTSGERGVAAPDYVFESHGFGFGVSPSPDEAYTIRYRHFVNYTQLVNPLDTVRIPDSFTSTIIDGALYHMFMHRDNSEQAAIAQQSFEGGIKALKHLYVNNVRYLYDTRVQFGGNPFGRGRQSW